MRCVELGFYLYSSAAPGARVGRETLWAESGVLALASLLVISCGPSACGPRVRVHEPRQAARRVPLPRGLRLVLRPNFPAVASESSSQPEASDGLGARTLSARVASFSQQQSLPRHPVRSGAGSAAREPAQAPQVRPGLGGSTGAGHWGAAGGRLTRCFL